MAVIKHRPRTRGPSNTRGLAAQRRLMRRIAIACSAIVLFLLVIFMSKPVEDRGHMKEAIRSKLRQRFSKHAHELGGGTADVFAKDNPILEQIMMGKLHLVDITVDHEAVQTSDATSYKGLTGHFCKLEWKAYKDNPSAMSMFHHLVEHSPSCAENRYMADLDTVVKAARHYDKTHADAEAPGHVKTLELGAAVFHESRCGSTLIANMLTAMHPDKHRVYSESSPPLTALTLACGESYERCPEAAAATMLRDVIYLMSRSDSPVEERVFFKFQSKGSRHMPAFARAFPKTHRIFVYRDPVQVLQSHLKAGRNALCLHQTPPGIVAESATRHHRTVDVHHSPAGYCAAHLASITDAAVEAIQDDVLATALNYADLPERFHDEILPFILKIPVGPSELHRIEQVASQYSKGGDPSKAGAFVKDSENKSATASDAVKDAAVQYLEESYTLLEAAAEEAKQRVAIMNAV